MSELALKQAGYAVTTAADGLEGWTALAADPFDIVVTDNNMPRLTGMELIAKARMKGLTVPFIVASGSVGRFHDTGNQWLHLAATLPKPFGPGELVATVRRVLGAASISREEPHVPSSAPADAWSRIQPFPRWGINE
jgi:two-component system chemotaxis response regulator CheY